MAHPFEQESDSDDDRGAWPPAGTQVRDVKTQASTLPLESWHTQPTQILQTPHRPAANGYNRSEHTSPAVQVAASSPSAPSPKPWANGSTNGRVNLMAPPGTEFRHPSQHAHTQVVSQNHTQATQVLDHDVGMISDSSDEGNTMKPAYFEKGGLGHDTARVNDSSRSKFSTDVSRFAYGAAPKRAAPDDMASAYAARRVSKAPRTQGSSKPVTMADIAEDDVADWALRAKIKDIRAVLSNVSVRRAYDALVKKKNNYEDALSHLVAEDDQRAKEEKTAVLIGSSDSETSPSQKPQAKQTVAKTKSIAERYGNTQAKASSKPRPLSPELIHEAPRRKRKLVRGGHAPDLISTPDRSQAGSSPPHPKVRQGRRALDSDSESGETTPHTEDGRDASEQVQTELEAQLLDMMNHANLSALLDLSGATSEEVSTLVNARPFETLDAVRTVSKKLPAKGKRKPRQANIGDRIVNTCLDVLEAYDRLNKLVFTCEERGKPVLEQMKAWGLANYGETSSGELEMTKLETPASVTDQLSQPSNMSSELRLKDYQLAGLNWLSLLYRNGLSAILADDMGLGKTCQVIAFLAQLKLDGQKSGGQSSEFALIVVPGSTLENWLREIGNFCPELVCEPYYGAQKDRYEKQYRIKDMVEKRQIDVLVTTYDMASKKQDAHFLRTLRPDICVYDEAHHLKNSTTTRYQQLMQIRVRKMRILLTGTPLQNNLVELSSLLGFLMPDIFEEHKPYLESVFSARAKVNTSQGQSDVKKENAEHDGLLSQERVGRARRMLTPFILRRKKVQVLQQLPIKTNAVEYCELSGTHKAVYADALKAYSRDGDVDESKLVMKSSLINLRKAAIHPLLFRRHYDDQAVEKIARHHADLDYPPSATPEAEYRKRYQQYLEYYTGMSDYEIHRAIVDTLPRIKSMKLRGEPWLVSDKVKALLRLLDQHAKEGHTTLIFSQFTSVMDILEAVFETKGVPFYRLDGQTDMNTRQQLIDDFTAVSTSDKKDRKPVFMLSTRAGGQGINLTVANRVVIFDSGFNPQDDVQAENRAHRVGQTRPVEVVRLVAQGTVEEAILALGERKLRLDALVAGATDGDAEGAEMVGKLLAQKCRVQSSSLESDGDVKPEPVDIEVKPDPDVGESFMKGLKNAGLDMNAAARKPLKR